jgi:hypothetical protein
MSALQPPSWSKEMSSLQEVFDAFLHSRIDERKVSEFPVRTGNEEVLKGKGDISSAVSTYGHGRTPYFANKMHDLLWVCLSGNVGGVALVHADCEREMKKKQISVPPF